MYLVYNREFKKVAEYKRLKDLQSDLGEDFKESTVDTLAFIRGSTVIRRGSLEGLVESIVRIEKEKVMEYITLDLDEQEDETVELRTENKNLEEKLGVTVERLKSVETKISGLIKTFEEVGKVEEEGTEESVEEADEDLDVYVGESFGEDLQRVSRTEIKEELVEGGGEPEIEPRSYNFSFINVIEENKLPHINELRGKEIIRVEELAQRVYLKEEEVKKLVRETLTECGGYPKFQNPTVVSPEEAVWIIVSALKKNRKYPKIEQRFEKTKTNAKQLYKAWDLQKSSIEMMLK